MCCATIRRNRVAPRTSLVIAIAKRQEALFVRRHDMLGQRGSSMLRNLLSTLIIIFGASATASHAADPSNAVGVRSTAAMASERGEAIALTLWYPAGPGGTAELVGGNKVFEGVPAQRDAPVADGAFPVVLLAHGGLRAAPNLGNWIAAALAGQGMIVAVTHAPAVDGQAAVAELWRRPADLSAALTAIEQDPALSAHTEQGKVGAVGFLRGGTSVLSLAGAVIDAESYRHSCDDVASGPDCRWFAKNGIDLKKTDAKEIARSLLDRRIKVVVAVDPELSRNFEPASLAVVRVPVDIINLGPADRALPWLDASVLGGLIPGARYHLVPDATPFSSFSLCTPKGPALLAAEGEDETVCQDGENRSREEIHAEIADMISTALRRGFSAQ
jgi:predicted dienelactone hydrolase